MHWHYYNWRYVVFLAVALAATNFLYSATTPQAPANKRVDVVIIGSAGGDTSSWSNGILFALPPDQQTVDVTSTPIVEGQESTIYQLVGARMAANEGAIWILPKDMFASFATSGAFMTLDDKTASFDIPAGTDLSIGRVNVKPDDTSAGESHLCGIPLDKCLGLANLLDPTGMVLAFPVYAVKNYDNAVIAANWLLDRAGLPQVNPDATPEQAVSVSVMAHSYKARSATAWQTDMLKALGTAGQKQVNITLDPFHVGREAFAAGVIASEIKAGHGTAWIIPRDIFASLVQQGVLLPLDSDIASFQIPEGTDLTLGQAAVMKDGKAGDTHQYGIPMDKCAGLSQLTVPDGMLMVFPSWKKLDFNYAGAKAAANWLLTSNEPPEAAAAPAK